MNNDRNIAEPSEAGTPMPERIGQPRLRAVAELMRELSDPVRLAVVEDLGDGPRTASQLADDLDIAAPRLANHLSRLRAAGIVTVTRSGRHAIYQLADRRITGVLSTLGPLAAPGRDAVAAAGPAGAAGTSMAEARTCYDHLAGRAGVAVFDRLIAAGALLAPPDADNSEIALGPGAAAGFAALGVDVHAQLPPRRKLAITCLDWTEQRPHLGGALGAAVLDSALASGWVRKGKGRTLEVTPAGRLHLGHPASPVLA